MFNEEEEKSTFWQWLPLIFIFLWCNMICYDIHSIKEDNRKILYFIESLKN